MRLITITFIVICSLMLLSSEMVWSQNISEENLTENSFDPDFKERYKGKNYNYEGKEVVGTTRGGSGNYEEYKEERNPVIKEENNETESNSNSSFAGLDWLFILALVLAVVYLAYILLNEGGQGLFTGNRQKKVRNPEEITVENIEQTDVDSMIESAEKAGDFRLAIRYYYLLVLKNLSLKGFIKLEDDKTNQEYFNEIAHHEFSDNFAYTSYLYNYIWYGEFTIASPEYAKAKTSFDQLIKRMGQ